jgi:alanine racemase
LVSTSPGLLSWVEVDAAAIRNNILEFRRRLEPHTRLGAVVKANAYGHGLLEAARIAAEAGADWLCVNNVEEGARLREAGIEQPVLVMGYVPLGELDAAVRHGLRLVVYNLETLDGLERAAGRQQRRVPVHIKLETGTYRQGVAPSELPCYVSRIRESTWLALEGLSTHLANIEDTTDHRFAEEQISAFGRARDSLRRDGVEVPVCHAACSAAALLFTRTHLDLARIGISLYGLWPSRETYVSCAERGKPALGLRPALAWKTRVAQVKDVPEGAYIGYGCTYRTTRPSRIAVLPVGYHEGYDRGLSGVAYVLLRGRRAPVRGRVCMNISMVDVTDIAGVGLEDEVVLLGAQGDERITAEQLAAWCGTISYEIVARIHPALPRVVVNGPTRGQRDPA